MTLKEQLLTRANEYCNEHGITKAALGALVMKDNKFFAGVESGARGFTVRTFEKVMAAMTKTPAQLRADAKSEAA